MHEDKYFHDIYVRVGPITIYPVEAWLLAVVLVVSGILLAALVIVIARRRRHSQ